MDIIFDSDKNNLNIAKHGISLAMACDIEWDYLQAEPDTRHEYGEVRMVGFAPIGERVYCVVFTDRENARRMISLRKANTREVDDYEHNI
jgi:uncharacterized protein